MTDSAVSSHAIQFRLSSLLSGEWVAESVRGLLGIDGPALSADRGQDRWQLDAAGAIRLHRNPPEGY